ncbi:MAG: hypothetical protein J7604_03435 [Sporocytophaga sp.]|uniref:hypothetical protein n=1 Tax=Sporocytophaga sp. TaxID=2231183 RepID=UPI001B142FE8|nr:hypothetical protein [Sporocytophaga sp.]MBO9699234.1 hypothetical protein [Sporocytophaga sp.]
MKKNFTFLFAIFSVIFNVSAQNDLFLSDEIVWYGIDFSNAKFVGEFSQFDDAGTKSNKEIQRLYFPEWNDLIINEPGKYNIRKFYGFEFFANELDLVMKNNADADINVIFDPSTPNRLSKTKIQKLINSYNIKGKKGLGLVFIVDSFNKMEGQGYIYVTFFDQATKKVLSTNLYEGKPGGIGVKNYWARVILNVMEVSGKEFKQMKKGGL